MCWPRTTKRVLTVVGGDHERPDVAAAGDAAGQGFGGIVMADDADQGTGAAESGDIARHVGGAAREDLLGLVVENGRRAFRRDARDVAFDEAVHHHIADAQGLGIGQGLDLSR
jgi:hypothetical protein